MSECPIPLSDKPDDFHVEPICCEAICTGNFCPSCGKPVEPKPTKFYFVPLSNGVAIRNDRHVCIGKLLWDKNRKPDQMARAWIERIVTASKVAFSAVDEAQS